jgi:rubrerythrin
MERLLFGDYKMGYYDYEGYQPYSYGYIPPYWNTPAATLSFQQMMNTDIFTYPQNLDGALELILEALSGETEDRVFYMWLINQASSEEDKQIISGIRDNEIGHYALFRQIYQDLTGEMPPSAEGEAFVEPESYCAGLSRALLGEQNAVQKYRKILYAMQSRLHINIMVEIITDEIRHGILYSYLYSKNGCGSQNQNQTNNA